MRNRQKHSSLNYHKNLFEAIADMYWPGKFQIPGHIIYLISDITVAVVAIAVSG